MRAFFKSLWRFFFPPWCVCKYCNAHRSMRVRFGDMQGFKGRYHE